MNKEDSKLFGEIYLDSLGEAHFICHNKGLDFKETREGLEKFLKVIKEQLDKQKQCPFYER